MRSNNTKMKQKYKTFSIIYDNIFKLLENLIFMNKKNSPRYALGSKIKNNNLQILDVCCGSGRASLPFAGSTNTIVGIDLSSDMLALAKKKNGKTRSQNVSFLQMDATKIDFPDEKFDVVMSSFALHEMNSDLMTSVLMEKYRVLKKGGKLYIVDYGEEYSFLNKLIFSTYLKICYPERIMDFLKYDWDQILSSIHFQFDYIEKYKISRLICATKIDN
ncbi:MAG: class I SAM-dependent methyltransferase [Desulfobacterales bacterium]|nr:class I SAM-dependent methyltransferase [Desulfobacterales bacterium]MCP4158552.1 class I SAM-dependent methyltransferase [Deltaproteobacteria bacterium]